VRDEQLRFVAQRAVGKPCPWCSATGRYATIDDGATQARLALRSLLSGFLIRKVVRSTIDGSQGPTGRCTECGNLVALCPSCSNPDRRISHFIRCSSCHTEYAAGDIIPPSY
jgi:hypothetical protein